MNDVFEVLIDFFAKIENGFFSTQQQDVFLAELIQLGISLDKLQDALSGVKIPTPPPRMDNYALQTHRGVRIYTPMECFRINKKCRSFLLSLEQQGVLNPFLREMVIDQLLRLPQENITLQQIKWVTLSVLFSQPNKAAAINMERFLLNETPEQMH